MVGISRVVLDRFPRLYAAASLKQLVVGLRDQPGFGFPRLYAAASLKPVAFLDGELAAELGFPRLYAAASLKPALAPTENPGGVCFPRLYAAASLKHLRYGGDLRPHGGVFRGFMPRPH